MRVADGGGGTLSMQIEVPPAALLETAAGLEAAANKLEMWLSENAHRFNAIPPGSDQVSINMAKWFTDSAFGEMGAIPAARQAVDNLYSAAQQMRATAKQYGLTDDATAANLGSTGA